MLVGVSALAVFILARPAALLSQALERSLYVTMLDKSGAPVPNLGPTDFIVREDNVAREVLRVVPASDPMQIAIMVDNSTAAGPLRAGYPPRAAVVHREAGGADRVRPAQRNRPDYAGEPADDPRRLFDRSGSPRQGRPNGSGRTRSPAGSTC